MESLILKILDIISKINEYIYFPLHELVDKINVSHWLSHSIIECLKMIPLLFIIFIAIELAEKYYFNKLIKTSHFFNKLGPIIGSLVASLPQCGFSVIASSLYAQKYITKGTLIAVFLATSDEAIPILMSSPKSIKLVLPLLLTKIIIAIIAGLLIDVFLSKTQIVEEINKKTEIDEPKGCHHHHIIKKNNLDIIIHPLKHTFNIFVFILLITISINYLIHITGGPTEISKLLLNNSILQPIIASIIGLIPSCAISVGLTLLYVNGGISFGSVIAGLCSSAGLGILVLIKKNTSIKDTIKIILILLIISMLAGILIQLLDI